MTKTKLQDFMWDKVAGQYDYKCGDTFYQIYKYKQYWIVYETEEHYEGTPENFDVLYHTSTLNDAKKVLEKSILSHYNRLNK